MRINNLISFTYILFAAAIIAIGRIYDERLELLGLNFSVFISGFFILLSCIMIISIRSIKLTSTRALFYMFLCIILFSPILWGFYDFIDYGIEKYLNFSILIIPLLLIILEKFSYNDINNFFNILIWFIVVLALVSFSIVQESNERLSVFGGGPIIFARWMLIGIFILFFTNKYKKRKLSWLLMCMFFALSLAAGSKGPILAFLMTFSIYFFLNFQKLIIKVFAIIIILFSFTQFIDNSFSDKLFRLGKTERLITNDNTSTNIRIQFIERSVELATCYPFGVGVGNWQTYCNKEKPYHLLKHEYPHNLVLEVLSELGFIGGILFLLVLCKVLYFTYFRMVFYSFSKDSFYPLLFYLQLFLIFTALFSGDLNDSRLLFVILAMSLIHKPLIKPD